MDVFLQQLARTVVEGVKLISETPTTASSKFCPHCGQRIEKEQV